ncbi:hypothetical protein ADL29_33860 [Streptomyces chattanoogensis]|uniref:Uncharacterized protein n=1 Tax=Streptomyces chattanoogensis TaxID=66876 RepID=A0A0N0GW95_9ACTN|nr:hypothetical protein ADL29_33860 [Streptomyces chattanoogensis]
MTPAQHLVAHLGLGARHIVTGITDHIADDDPRTLHDHPAVDGTGIVRGPGTAPAQRIDLQHLYPVGEFHRPLRAREELAADVGGAAGREDIEAEVVHDAGELVDPFGGEELRLVGDDVVDPAAGGEPAAYQALQSAGRAVVLDLQSEGPFA